MKTATVHELKQELSTKKVSELTELCLRLAKFKKENKELLTYLLYEAHHEQEFVTGVKQEMENEFAAINRSNLYYARKSLRKIVRIVNKYSRYSGIKETELEFRLHFCQLVKISGIPIDKNSVISNLYASQLKKSGELLESLHEDLQYDFRRKLIGLK